MINYIVCLKWGNKYGPEYVNTLEQMVRRYCTLPFEFVCFTEDPTGLNNTVKVMPIPQSYGVNGWWHKPLLFNPSLPLEDPQGTILYIDLDVIVFRSIVKRDFKFWPDEWVMSYKWEMRGKPPMVRNKDGVKDFISPGVPKIHPQTSIAVFHGDPQPKTCQDPWCKENWK